MKASNLAWGLRIVQNLLQEQISKEENVSVKRMSVSELVDRIHRLAVLNEVLEYIEKTRENEVQK